MMVWMFASLPLITMPLSGPTEDQGSYQGDLSVYLETTTYLDHEDPAIQNLMKELTAELAEPRERAIAIHDYVRDEIKFGFEPAFYNMKASKVLAAKRGFCNNQSTLFIALLRAAGIPARHRFYALSSNILDGIINPGTTYVDHSISEVFIEDKWIKVDSYIIDSDLGEGARGQLESDLGFGIRKDGKSTWHGREDSFSQFHPDYIKEDFGIFVDIGDFYKRAENPNNKLNGITKLMLRFAVGGANKRIQNLRQK